ncbi:hypothetical protein QBC35DRAFT_387318 [Podospora australis]|uniref:Uncharacterized protein n=1 Tax=Podospora australis TaxID=1536484 RepID=A0AAN6WQE7_9PEZI|nr:hypothetical protein QBC35DRAFT_387318 [Podospora australis]
MAAYYDNTQWTSASGGGQPGGGWDHQTPPPARSGANSAIPREEPAAFARQFEEVDRAVDNLLKSGKMFGGPGGGRREWHPKPSGPARRFPDFDPRAPGGGPGARPHSVADFGDVRGPHQGSNLQNFYANQRYQPSRGSNEAEQMIQAKRKMAAQRERELRNYHQEQQFHRTTHADVPPFNHNPTNKLDRTLSPGNMSEEDRRKLIAQQRSALYGEGPFAESGGYVDETGAPRPGLGAPPVGPAALRGHSPLAYDYGRAPPAHQDASQIPTDGGQGTQSAGPNERSRANSNSSPQSNPGSKSVFDAPGQQPTRTSASSPGGSPPRQGAQGGKQGQGSVAPIGTRPSTTGVPTNSALNKRSTTPLPSPLSQGYNVSAAEDGSATTNAVPGNPTSATTETPNVGMSGWGARSGGWGAKSGLGSVQASVWG